MSQALIPFFFYLTSCELKGTMWIPKGPPSLDTSTGLSMLLQDSDGCGGRDEGGNEGTAMNKNKNNNEKNAEEQHKKDDNDKHDKVDGACAVRGAALSRLYKVIHYRVKPLHLGVNLGTQQKPQLSD